ncbi:hypothetical protein PRUB_a0413 [Pseudoalteromonas rubra]|uniref:Uncharacterized protein n=1 Tax=Pseudoalteromonas rubra TaxID=43658 RepID=A0A8T0C5G2_9GAMM|nr:hypothetical protein PRUB_a0413 [Pseudoalteromonas rubra]
MYHSTLMTNREVNNFIKTALKGAVSRYSEKSVLIIRRQSVPY